MNEYITDDDQVAQPPAISAELINQPVNCTICGWTGIYDQLIWATPPSRYICPICHEDIHQQAKPAPEKPEPLDNQHLKLARQYMEQYQHRINQDNFYGDLESRTRYEDAAYKQSMMHAAYAQAEAATRQAEVAESFLEFVAEFVDKTDLIDALSNWEIRQR